MALRATGEPDGSADGRPFVGKAGVRLREDPPGNRWVGWDDARATARRTNGRRPSDGSKGKPADAAGQRTGNR
jgi:hypothetical protein